MSGAFWILFEIAINLYQGFLVTWFLNRALTPKKEKQWLFAALNTLALAGCLTTYVFWKMPGVDTWVFLPSMLYAWACFQDDLRSKAFWMFLGIVTMMAVSSFVVWVASVVLQADPSELLKYSVSRIVTAVMVNVALTVTVLVISGKKGRVKGNLPSALLFVVLHLILMVIVDILYLVGIQIGGMTQLLSLASGLVMGVAVVSLALYEIMGNYAERYYAAKQKEEERRIAMQRVVELKNLYASLHSLRHDMKNHIQVATTMLQNGKSGESAAYLAQIEERMFSVFTTGCLALDSALTMKELEMRRAGIAFRCDLCNLERAPLTDFEMCTVIGNLLDNAIEAVQCAELPSAEKVISLRMYIVRQMLCINCENPAQESRIRQENGKFLTTKKTPGHGLGFSNIESTIRNASGVCRFSCESGVFRADISIPML